MPSILAIQIGLHYSQSDADYPVKSAGVTAATESLLRQGLLEEIGKGRYRRASALKHWVQALTRVPFPVIE